MDNKPESAPSEVTKNPADLPAATQLAIQRTQLAHDRTLLAWVRTATSLISFGFTIYKFFEAFHKKGESNAWLGYRTFAMLMIGTGLTCLVIAAIQNKRDAALLLREYGIRASSLALVLAALISILGILGFAAVVLRQ